MLSYTQDKIKFMSEPEQNIIFTKISRLFNSVLQTKEIKFDRDLILGLYNVVSSDKNESDRLEQDIKRIESLQHVHEQSAEVFNKVKLLQEGQKNILSSLKEDEKALEYVKESFQENISVIKENLANIKSRISKLKN